ncbi:MAG TPA: hypothetical protein VMZ92_09340 [Planctomycetota bacterium]|nr:hypothetical protein [Planctomycetota bacterium]
MEEQPDIPHGGHVVGPVPLDALAFPDRCVRCGKAAPFEAKLRKYTGLGFPLGIVVGFCLPLALVLPPLTKEIELRVPTCRWCREWHQLGHVLALLGTLLAVLAVGIVAIFLGVWVVMEFRLAWWGVLTYVLAVLGVAFLIMWFGGTRLIDFVSLRMLGVAVHSYDKTDNSVVLSFKDPALAEDVAARSLVVLDTHT